MKKRNSLERLYDEPNILEPFMHPKYCKGFRYITDKRIVRLAEKICDKIMSSNYKTVIVSETGAYPFALICRMIIKKKYPKLKIVWKHVKFPREKISNISPIIMHELSHSEREQKLSADQIKRIRSILPNSLRNKCKEKSIGYNIEHFCRYFMEMSDAPEGLDSVFKAISNYRKNKFQKIINIMLEGTSVYEIFSRPFLYFDEYVDSGTTLYNAHNYFNIFSSHPRYRIISYCVKHEMDTAESNDLVYYALFNKNTEITGYEYGVYPFENRVDIIGHFYFIDKKNKTYKKTSAIKEEYKHCARKNSTDNVQHFIDKISSIISERRLLQDIHKNCSIQVVREYIDADHIIRFIIYNIEKRLNNNVYAEFLWQLFDMYGPSWSPMPKEWHLDFYDAFERSSKEVSSIIDSRILMDYKKIRSILFYGISSVCETRRKAWLNNMRKEIKVIK